MTLILHPPCPHGALLARLYGALPLRVQSFPVVVCEEAEAAFKRRIRTLSPPHPQATGADAFDFTTTPPRSLIALRLKKWTGDGGSVLYHEIGHASRALADGKPLGLLTLPQIRDWQAWWKAHVRSMPTAYGMVNESEGFAEAAVEVLSGHVWPGYRKLPPIVRAEMRRLLGLLP